MPFSSKRRWWTFGYSLRPRLVGPCLWKGSLLVIRRIIEDSRRVGWTVLRSGATQGGNEGISKRSAQLQHAVEDMQRMKVSTGEWFKKLVIKKNWKRILGFVFALSFSTAPPWITFCSFFKGNSRKASADLMISPNPTSDLPPDSVLLARLRNCLPQNW